MINHVEVTEWCQIRRRSILGSRGDEANRTGDDSRDEKFVVEYGWATFFIRVDFNVFFEERSTVIVGSVTKLPGRFDRLSHVEFGGGGPLWAFSFDLFEVWMRIALDELFGVVLGLAHGCGGGGSGGEVVGLKVQGGGVDVLKMVVT